MMGGMRRILVATDGSRNSEAAVRFAASLDNGKVAIDACYIVDYANVGRMGDSAGRGTPDLLQEEGRRALSDARQTAAALDARIETHLCEGDRVDRIIECAKELRADTIVIGTRGRHGAVDAIFGSTTRGLFRKAELPIVAVSPTYVPVGHKGIRRILVGFDGSAAAAEVAEIAYDVARLYDAEIDFVYVIDTDRTPEAANDDAEALAAMVLGSMAVKAAQRGLRTKQHVIKGPVCETLVTFAKEHGNDLIALGTHGRTGFDRLIMGSVAESVAVDSPVPVLVRRHVTHVHA